MKRTAAARLAFKPNLPAHQLHQPLRNRETEARSAVLPRRRAVRLRERLENQRSFFLRETNTGIAYLEINRDAFLVLAVLFGFHYHFALLCKLQGVSDQIH